MKHSGQIIGEAIGQPVPLLHGPWTSIRDNFVIKHSSGITKRLSNSPLRSRQISCKVFSYSKDVIVPKKLLVSLVD